MANWNESDVGKRIVYRNSQGEFQEVAIYSFDEEAVNALKVIDYPIALKSKITTIGLIRNQEVLGKENLKNPGDWYMSGRVSNEELSELERLAQSSEDI